MMILGSIFALCAFMAIVLGAFMDCKPWPRKWSEAESKTIKICALSTSLILFVLSICIVPDPKPVPLSYKERQANAWIQYLEVRP